MYGVKVIHFKGIIIGKSQKDYTQKEIINHKRIAKELMGQGYRRVSSKSGVLSRVDVEDWKNKMSNDHAPWSKEEGDRWVMILGDSAADHYRRVYSNDKIQVPLEVSKNVKSSDFDPIGYIS